jgi:hypothetical protein
MAADSPDVRTLEVRGWLLRASEDLRAGLHDLTAVPPLLNDVAFHAQQCAEKAMKALLVHREQAFRKTHNLTELGGAECLADRRGRARGLSLPASRDLSAVGCLC